MTSHGNTNPVADPSHEPSHGNTNPVADPSHEPSHGNTNPGDDPSHELESHFLLRLPQPHAGLLREVLANGGHNLRDRLRIRIEDDMRHGSIYLDETVLPAKIVDLPCISESHKTIDRKDIYKTGDICQMMICTEIEEPEEDSKPVEKKDGVLEVDKKYLFPHGITPPLKNVRKRRFRRTRKKKQYTDPPEIIEKEVRSLLRQDYEAHHVSWEVVDEEDDKMGEGGGKDILMQGSKTNEDPTPSSSSRKHLDVEHLFGEALSDSDEESEMMGGGDDDESRLSMDGDHSQSQTQVSDSIASYSQETRMSKKSSSSSATSFTGDMFSSGSAPSGTGSASGRRSSPEKSTRANTPRVSGYASMSRKELLKQREVLRTQLIKINTRRRIQEAELSTMDNIALRHRLIAGIEKLASDHMEKKKEIEEVYVHLEQCNTD